MQIEAEPDPPVKPFRPDRELIAIAHNAMLRDETPAHRFVRQRWEECYGAVHVGLQAVRQLYPGERDRVSDEAKFGLASALEALTEAYTALDDMASEMVGETMHGVMSGEITDRAALERIT